MAQERIFGTGSRREEETDTPEPTTPPTSGAAQAQRDTQGTDDLLAEIDGVLETNAEAFVKGFVQKGGQ
ncbi:ubiquitin-like protein Pup [Kocuria tytonicola]|uniref:Prokaryotic ubiquitin-like protein Pup n=1 Tax=Kocuria tytonicola TaxID=2055946 RepID=A0A3L9LWQ9_9MICC|nr:ubiquitin-like protein Pup [Kocuria tytonicola]RLY95039.1 ubiquitin-like protein Pup [Kocuria tytonicola]RLZ03212.1 ubiquitin-like protein Pup [Kocuria tytonicola]